MGAKLSKDELLYREVMKGNQEKVKARLRAGASLEWIDKEGRTPLILACTIGDLLATTLISLGANIHSYKPGAYGGTPLHHAATRGLEKTVKMLLSRGANPLATNDDYRTPLDLARMAGRVTVVRIIEKQISLFYGMIRQFEGNVLFGTLMPRWGSKTIWAVVLPSNSQNPGGRPEFKLAIYESAQVSRTQADISLSEFEIKEPNFDLQYPILELVETSAERRFKFLSMFEDGKPQLRRLYEACKGIRPNISEGGAETLTNDPTVSRPSVSANSVAVSAAAWSPSAPPLPAEEVLGDTSGTCIICWGAPLEGVCVPCGHHEGCMSCLNEIKVNNRGCPVCRARIEQVIRIQNFEIKQINK